MDQEELGKFMGEISLTLRGNSQVMSDIFLLKCYEIHHSIGMLLSVKVIPWESEILSRYLVFLYCLSSGPLLSVKSKSVLSNYFLGDLNLLF